MSDDERLSTSTGDEGDEQAFLGDEETDEVRRRRARLEVKRAIAEEGVFWPGHFGDDRPGRLDR